LDIASDDLGESPDESAGLGIFGKKLRSLGKGFVEVFQCGE
jgi:hypothetical protein